LFKKYIPALIWAGVIVLLCGFPGNRIPNFDLLNRISFDKLVHTAMFSILTFLLLLAERSQFNSFKLNAFILEAAVMFGVLMETMQTAIFINRFGEWVDMVANTIGAILGLLLARFYIKKRAA
jgi:VanZ family protein